MAIWISHIPKRFKNFLGPKIYSARFWLGVFHTFYVQRNWSSVACQAEFSCRVIQICSLSKALAYMKLYISGCEASRGVSPWNESSPCFWVHVVWPFRGHPKHRKTIDRRSGQILHVNVAQRSGLLSWEQHNAQGM